MAALRAVASSLLVAFLFFVSSRSCFLLSFSAAAVSHAFLTLAAASSYAAEVNMTERAKSTTGSRRRVDALSVMVGS